MAKITITVDDISEGELLAMLRQLKDKKEEAYKPGKYGLCECPRYIREKYPPYAGDCGKCGGRQEY
jgi:hypothetical protein